jgi:hypothetical protein
MKALSGCSLQNEANERIAIDITALTQIIMVVAIISISSVYASIYPVGNACQGITGKYIITRKGIMQYHEAFNTIKEFYDHAWQQLIFIIGILVGVVGVVPIAWNIIQQRSGRKRMADFEKRLKLDEETLKKLEKAIESITAESRIVMGGIYLHQGNLQILEYKTHGEESGPDPLNIYLSYLKSLDCFLDSLNMKYIDVAYDQLTQASNLFDFSKTSKDYPELKRIYNQIIEKLEKNKDVELYSNILFYLKDIFCTIEHNNKQLGE